jgi:type III secretion protein D
VVAFGVASEAEWVGGDVPALPAAAAAKPRRRAELWLTGIGAGIAIASAGALMLAHVAAAPRTEAAIAPPTLDVALRSSEFSMLGTTRRRRRPHPPERSPGHAGAARAPGRVAGRARLRAAAWTCRWTRTLARDVTDVFRVNGVAVQAHVTGPGLVVAEAAERDPERLARAVEVVRRDVRGLDKLAVENRARPLPPPAPPVPDDPGKRIASLVPGDPGYLVTADGSRYFIGAVLPSGHRVTAIAQQRVTLERDGQSQTLNF